MTEPLVTIAIPTFNRHQSLLRAVRSAQAQDYPHIEILILDNASTDGTEAFCEEVAAGDPRVRYIRHARNRGAAANFNSGIEHSSGSFFQWLADDDWIDPDHVSRCAEALLADPGCVLVAAVTGYYVDDELVATEEFDVAGGSLAERVLTFYRPVGRNSAFYGLVRIEALRRVTPLGERFADDILVVGRLAALGGLRTVRTTRSHKALGGASSDLRELARSSGLRNWQARFPFAWASFLIASDIRSHDVFSVLTPAARRRLSLRVQARYLWLLARAQALRLLYSAMRALDACLAACLGPSSAGRLRQRYRSLRRTTADPVEALF